MLNKLLESQSSWERLMNTTEPIIIYGTGNGADLVMDELCRLGVAVTAVAASEGFVRKRNFRGFEVRSITDVLRDYPQGVIVPAFASSIREVMDSIKALADSYTTIMPVVPVFGNKLFNREYIESNMETLLRCRDLLWDTESKRVFDGMVRFQYTGELSHLFSIESRRNDALKDILHLSNQEHMLDLGAYRGDTIRELIDLCGGYASVTALEPDTKTFGKLSDYAQDMENITLLPYAVYNENTELIFSGGGGRQSTLCGSGKYKVQAVTVDSITRSKKITYVKMDVEGVEKEALEGMRELIKTQKPKLSISAYHRSDDLCTLIPLIHSINPDYRIHLRHHPYIPCWDTNLYCI